MLQSPPTRTNKLVRVAVRYGRGSPAHISATRQADFASRAAVLTAGVMSSNIVYIGIVTINYHRILITRLLMFEDCLPIWQVRDVSKIDVWDLAVHTSPAPQIWLIHPHN
jgi:hypothetical protein